MASNVAPPKNTGGGGFVFEDDVCAWLLACMLVGEQVFGPQHGAPTRLDFQTRPDGWFIDDVLVTTGIDGHRNRFALSIKSKVQFTAASAPSDFVVAAWEQWLHVGSKAFDASCDFMGLVTPALSGAAAISVSGLVEKARANDPGLFPARLATPHWASEDERSLFASFDCPEQLGQPTTNIDTARLLQRLILVGRDFGAVPSESQNTALELCRRAVRGHTAADAQTLWGILREVSSELRPRAGSLLLNGLIGRLRTRVSLADYPEHAGDWQTLDARSAREVTLVRESIAGRIRLSREAQTKEILDLLTANSYVTLIGQSGVGKSGLGRSLFESRRANGDRTLWVEASSLDRAADLDAFEASLQLRHPLAELLGRETSPEPLIIIDGLDRLYAEHAFRNLASLLRVVSGESPTTRWRILVFCQSQEWPRVLEALHRAGAPMTSWRSHEAAALSPSELRSVTDVVQSLGRLLLQPRIGSLLTNLKLLDLVVRRIDSGGEIDASRWVGESSVAEWFWSAEIDRGAERIARGHFARSLAQAQADQVTASISVDSLGASTLAAAHSLIADQLLVYFPGDRLAFAHDLYGDWTRLRILLNESANLSNFLKGRHESPLWHRAIRLLGIHLLERENGVAEWKALVSSFDTSEMTIVRDLLVEAPAFATNARTLLESVIQVLVARDGALLRRLLTRFLAFATVPDERMGELACSVGVDANFARATYRRPHWPYWLDVLEALHAHRNDALRVAGAEAAKIVEMWLEFAPPGTIRRRETAELAVMLGRQALGGREDHSEREDRARFYKCALLAAPERPDEVAELARTAAERVSRPVMPGGDMTPPQPPEQSWFGPGVMRGPWPHGPLARVDDEFQNVVLDSPSIQHLYRVRPAIAREVILATLIEAPYEEHWGGGGMQDQELDLVDRHKWHPALYTQGPFLLCLRENFAEGLELIMQLVDFASERSRTFAIRTLTEWRSRVLAAGQSEAEFEQALEKVPPQLLVLHDGTQELSFSGDAGSYGWSAGVTSVQGFTPLPPSAVATALMALEQYFYQRIDAGEDIADEVTAVLARSRSVALLGLLSDVGKRQPTLFDGPLRALLSAPEVYSWDITKAVQGRTHLAIGAFTHGQTFVKLAQQFHALKHRTRDLRYVAAERLLNSADMQTFFATVREWWKKRRSGGECLTEMADQLDLWLEPTNYQEREDPTHGLVIVNVALEKAQAGRAEEQRAMNDVMLVTSFPMRCRQVLDERQVQTDAAMEELWQSWLRVRDLAKGGPALPNGEERFGDEYVNAITGGITLFLCHPEWLARHVNRREDVENALVAIVDGPPEQQGFTGERDISTWSWDCFVAEAAALLWGREPLNPRWRRLVAEAIVSYKYMALRLLFSRCAEYRVLLREDFGRLRRLAVDRAHLRDRIDALLSWQRMAPVVAKQTIEKLQTEVETVVGQSVDSFVAETLEPLSSDWREFREANRFKDIDDLRRRWPDFRLMDFHVVRCSHDWLPLPDQALSAEERADVIQFWRVALDVVAARPRADLRRRDLQYPDEDERWVIEQLAALVLQLRPGENTEKFWAPIVDLHSEAHDWPEMFLNALHRRALSAEQMPLTYGPLVRQIAQRAFLDVEGKERWPWHEEVWDALLGLDGYLGDLWASRHTEHVAAIWDVVLLWTEKAPLDGRRLGKFARWISRPAAATIRLRTLPWFRSRLQADEEHAVYRDKDAEDDVAKLLNVVWEEDQNRLRGTPESFAAFRALLAWLVARQNSFGLDLQGRIGGLT